MAGQRSLKKTIGLVVLLALVAAVAIFGVRVASLVDKTLEEAATTPTPVPAFGNVMQVTPDPNAPTPEPLLRSGSQGDAVVQIQRRLQELGYYEGGIDGQYGPGTRSAVTWFQLVHGLDADGVVGSQTRAVLESAAAQYAPATPTPMPLDATDQGSLMLVNRQNFIPDDYQPADMVNMTNYCDASIVKIKENGMQAQRVAVDALMTMLRAAHRDGITVWQVSEGYRTRQTQQALFDQQVATYRRDNNLSEADAISATRLTVAEPGSSEHHTGLAFDITVPGTYFRDTQQAKWLALHCWNYGFIIRYTEEKQDITGYLAEPWHIRYVGVAHAQRMRDENLCLEEYLAKYN